jgi:hypothetical protein
LVLKSFKDFPLLLSWNSGMLVLPTGKIHAIRIDHGAKLEYKDTWILWVECSYTYWSSYFTIKGIHDWHFQLYD